MRSNMKINPSVKYFVYILILISVLTFIQAAIYAFSIYDFYIKYPLIGGLGKDGSEFAFSNAVNSFIFYFVSASLYNIFIALILTLVYKFTKLSGKILGVLNSSLYLIFAALPVFWSVYQVNSKYPNAGFNLDLTSIFFIIINVLTAIAIFFITLKQKNI